MRKENIKQCAYKVQKESVHKFVNNMEKQKMNHSHLFDVGSTINGLIITEHGYKCDADEKKKKAYKYKCSVCGYDCGEYYKNGVYHKEHMISESNLKHGAGCVVCSKNGFVVPTINSMYVLTPFVEQFLVNKDDIFKYAPKSNAQLECKCPDCGRKYIRTCAKLTYYGVPCICGDGFSYPEKFIFSMLQQLGVKFEPQYYFKNSMYRYDFYLSEYNILLEVNGIQHYKQKWERNEVQNDVNKKEFAFSCGFTEDNYIVLDCRESNLNFIKHSINNSKLGNILDCSVVDFEKCAEFASSNLAKTACELWNSGKIVKEISEQLKLHKHTIISYLKQGNDVGWCLYAPGDGVKRYHQNKNK